LKLLGACASCDVFALLDPHFCVSVQLGVGVGIVETYSSVPLFDLVLDKVHKLACGLEVHRGVTLSLTVDLAVDDIVDASLVSLVWDVVKDRCSLEVNVFLLTIGVVLLGVESDDHLII